MQTFVIVLIALVFGVIVGALYKRLCTSVIKGPSSSSVQRVTFSDTHRFEPEIFVCPPSIDPDAFEHSDGSDVSDE